MGMGTDISEIRKTLSLIEFFMLCIIIQMLCIIVILAAKL